MHAILRRYRKINMAEKSWEILGATAPAKSPSLLKVFAYVPRLFALYGGWPRLVEAIDSSHQPPAFSIASFGNVSWQNTGDFLEK